MSYSMHDLHGIVPPALDSPEAKRNENDEGSPDTGLARRVMALVRQIEKAENSPDRADLIHETSAILSKFIHKYSRMGLLEGNLTKARSVLDSSDGVAGMTATLAPGRPNKRARTAGHSSLDGTAVHAKEDLSGVEDELLLLSAIVRILGGNRKLGSADHQLSLIIATDTFDLISLASIVCATVCNVAAQNERVCALAERDILSRMGKSILTGLATTLQSLQVFDLRLDHEAARKHKGAVVSCLRASSSLAILFRAKLSRCSSIILSLRSTAWKLIVLDDIETQLGAAELVAQLLLTGANKKEPAAAWTDEFADTTEAIAVVLETVAPIAKKSITIPSSGHGMSVEMLGHVSLWTNQMSDTSVEEQKVTIKLLAVARGLSLLIIALLAREDYDATMMTARIPIERVLDLVGQMVAFPSLAESMFFSTKKRLRLERVEGGLLSISSIATNIANPIKSFGHDILDAVISGIGGSMLLPFGRRVLRIAESSLLSSSSLLLRKVLDPASNARIHPNRRKWLHRSIPLRAKAVCTFRLCVAEFGSNLVISPISDVHSTARSSSSECVKGIAIIGGSLLEQLSHNEDSDDWGSSQERAHLVACACESLSLILGATGAYLPIGTRTLVDSIACSCLSHLSSLSRLKPVLQTSSVRVAMLTLGSLCLSTPWPDGAISGILGNLRDAANACRLDHDGSVSLTSLSCLRQCDAVTVPRAPPLDILAARSPPAAHGAGPDMTTTSSLIGSLRTAREAVQADHENMRSGGAATRSDPQDKPEQDTDKELTHAISQKSGETRSSTASIPIDPHGAPAVGTRESQLAEVMGIPNGPGHALSNETVEHTSVDGSADSIKGERDRIDAGDAHIPATGDSPHASGENLSSLVANGNEVDNTAVVPVAGLESETSDVDEFLPDIVESGPDNADL